MIRTRQETPSTRRQRGLDWLVHVSAKDPVQRRRGRINAGLLLIATIVMTVILIVEVFVPDQAARDPQFYLKLMGGIALVIGIYYANRRGYNQQAGLAFALLLLVVNFALDDVVGEGFPGPAILLMPVLVAGLLGPPASAFPVAVLAIAGHFFANIQQDLRFVPELTDRASGLINLYLQLLAAAAISWMFSRTTKHALEESNQLGLALTTQQQELEGRVVLQSRYLQATTTIARAIVGVRDIDRLLDQTVNLVRETFGYYHVQVFLVDEEHEYAVLRSSTGEAGQTLMDRGHRLPVGSLSVIGQVTAGARSVIARDTDADAVHRRNELLPNTRSEMALPLVAGDRVIGALDLQSTEPDAFNQEVIPILQSLADQLTIAIENARLYAQTQSSLRELEELYGQANERNWSEFLSKAREPERRQVYGLETKAIEIQRSTIVKHVLGSGNVIVSTGEDGRQAFIAAPVVVRNEVVGVLGVEPDGKREWTQDDLQLLQGIAQRTALAVENARLYLQAQRAADRERLVNAIAGKLQRAPNLSMLLESAAQELAQALGTENVYAEISLEQPLAQARREVSGELEEPVEGHARPTAEAAATEAGAPAEEVRGGE